MKNRYNKYLLFMLCVASCTTGMEKDDLTPRTAAQTDVTPSGQEQDQDNPFLRMAGKKYADYSTAFFDEYFRIIRLDTTEYQKAVRQVEEVARQTGSREWALNVDFFKLVLYEKKVKLLGDELYPFEELERMAFELLDRTQKAKNLPLELRIRWKIIDIYWNVIKNYELAFEQCAIQDKILDTITSEYVPEKTGYYKQIAYHYYLFKDFRKAILYYNKALNEKETAHNQINQQQTRNDLGLSYLRLNLLDSAYFYFNAIKEVTYLSPENERRHILFDGIAERNMGSVLMERGDTATAIPLFENSIDKVLTFNDFTFASNCAVDLALININRGNLKEAKRYLDLATSWRGKTVIHRNNHLYYEALSKYYAATGEKKLSLSYMDRMLKEIDQTEEEFNSILLLRMEQKELAAQQRELGQEKVKRQQLQSRLMILALGFLAICGLLGWVSVLYRRKKEAYQELIHRSQEWALAPVKSVGMELPSNVHVNGNAHVNGNGNGNGNDNESYRKLYEQFQQLLTNDCIYRNNAMTIDKIATLLKSNKAYLSNAINKYTGQNFSTCINEYRIREAIMRISSDSGKYTLEGIGFEVGFNDRKTFYTAFKKITGLSPSAFKGNIQRQ